MEYDFEKFIACYVSVSGEKMLLKTEFKNESSWKKFFDLFEKQRSFEQRKVPFL